MRRKISFILLYWILWIFFFEIARIVFLISNFALAREAGFLEVLQSLLFGLRMDLSMASYLTLPVLLIQLMATIFPVLQKAIVFKVYTWIVLFFILLLIFTDINIFHAWGYRIDASPLKYLSNPREAWASVSNLPIVWILLLFALVLFSTARSFNRFIERSLPSAGKGNKWLELLVILFITGLFIIPLRGGVQLAPLNQSSVYFSENNFANQAALNAPWNFMHSLDHRTDSKTNPFRYLEPGLATSLVDSLQLPTAEFEHLLAPGITRPNVIILVWESFTEKATHLNVKGVAVTPGFNALKKEGYYFSNIYASGDRTDKGIVAILSGYPSQPITSIVKTPLKASKLPMLSRQFADSGYHTSFFYGGELEFANMKAYLLGGKFHTFISKNDFDEKDQNSKWGAHDGVVAKKVLNALDNEQQPFFSTWLTLSSHEPFETPLAPVIKGADDQSLFLNSLHYTDQVLFDFIKQCSSKPWWKNTVLLITADHGHRMPPTGKKIDDFKMPVMLLGGALASKGIVNEKVGSQTNIPSILLSQMEYPSINYTWSSNMLAKSNIPWAYFSFNNGFGFVNDSSYYIYDNVGRRQIESSGSVSERFIKSGMAVQQLTFEDYLSK